MISIFDELVKVTTSKPQQMGEANIEYLKGLIVKISKLPDEQFWKLSGGAQNWFNNAAASYTATKTIPDCPGFIEKKKEEEKKRPVIEASKLPKFRAAPNTVNTPKEKKVPGVMDAIRHCVILHPDWPSRKVFQHLKENGWPSVNLNTVTIDGGNIKRIIELAREMGFWDDSNYKSFESLTAGDANEAKAEQVTSSSSNTDSDPLHGR